MTKQNHSANFRSILPGILILALILCAFSAPSFAIVDILAVDQLEYQMQNNPTAEQITALANLYEQIGKHCEAADLLWRVVSLPPRLDELQRIATNYTSAGLFDEAGKTYLQAVQYSNDKVATSLAAVDCYLKAGKNTEARHILLQLQGNQQSKELWPYFGRLYFQLKEIETGKKYFNMLGIEAEKEANSQKDSRANFLYAIDCYLSAGNYRRAQELLVWINSTSPGEDVFKRLIRAYFEQKDYSNTIRACESLPEDLDIQNTSGWAYVGLDHMRNAQRTFRRILNRNPDHIGALAGIRFIERNQPWQYYLGYTNIIFNGYQDDRNLFVQSLQHKFRKISATVTHIRTGLKNKTSGTTGFSEDLFGVRANYWFNSTYGAQLQGITINNNDKDSDGGGIVGGKLFYVPAPDWLMGLGIDSSKYKNFYGTVISPQAGYKFNHYFRADLIGQFSSFGGNHFSRRSEDSAAAAILKTVYNPNEDITLVLAGIFGERRTGTEGENLFSLNSPDLYKDGGYFKLVYFLHNRIKLSLSYRINNFTSFWQEEANIAARSKIYDTNHTYSSYSFGLDFGF